VQGFGCHLRRMAGAGLRTLPGERNAGMLPVDRFDDLVGLVAYNHEKSAEPTLLEGRNHPVYGRDAVDFKADLRQIGLAHPRALARSQNHDRRLLYNAFMLVSPHNLDKLTLLAANCKHFRHSTGLCRFGFNSTSRLPSDE
jgi:hypothetical protein